MTTRAKIIINLEEWANALRSGKYKQGTGLLRDHEDNFCPLGVLCDINKEVTGEEWELDQMATHYNFGTEDLSVSSSAVSDLVGLWPAAEDRNRLLSRLEKALKRRSLSGNLLDIFVELSDITRLTFNEIADLIEGEIIPYWKEQTNGRRTWNGTNSQSS